MVEINEAPPIVDDLPDFESFPEKPIGNNETVAGNEPSPDTISGVNNSNTNQAPDNAAALQPVGNQPQSTSSTGIQTGSSSNQGGSSAINNLLNQGSAGSQPLDVGVANASTGKTDPPAALSDQTSAGGGASPWLIIIIGLVVLLLVVAYLRRNKIVQQPIIPEPERVAPAVTKTSSKAEKSSPKKKKTRKAKHGRKAR